MPRRVKIRIKKRPKHKIIPFRMKLDQHLFKIKYDVANLTADGSGNISLAFNTNNFAGAPESGNIGALFDEYKVLSVSFKYFPIRTPANASPTLDLAPLYIVNDYDDVTAITNTSEMLQYDNCRMKQLTRQFNHKMKFSTKATNDSLNRAGWNDLANPTTVGSIKLFSTGLDVNTTYGQYVLEFIIVVRGRR